MIRFSPSARWNVDGSAKEGCVSHCFCTKCVSCDNACLTFNPGLSFNQVCAPDGASANDHMQVSSLYFGWDDKAGCAETCCPPFGWIERIEVEVEGFTGDYAQMNGTYTFNYRDTDPDQNDAPYPCGLFQPQKDVIDTTIVVTETGNIANPECDGDLNIVDGSLNVWAKCRDGENFLRGQIQLQLQRGFPPVQWLAYEFDVPFPVPEGCEREEVIVPFVQTDEITWPCFNQCGFGGGAPCHNNFPPAGQENAQAKVTIIVSQFPCYPDGMEVVGESNGSDQYLSVRLLKDFTLSKERLFMALFRNNVELSRREIVFRDIGTPSFPGYRGRMFLCHDPTTNIASAVVIDTETVPQTTFLLQETVPPAGGTEGGYRTTKTLNCEPSICWLSPQVDVVQAFAGNCECPETIAEDTAWLLPSTGRTDPLAPAGNAPWINPANVAARDGVDTTSDVGGAAEADRTSQSLVASGYTGLALLTERPAILQARVRSYFTSGNGGNCVDVHLDLFGTVRGGNRSTGRSWAENNYSETIYEWSGDEVPSLAELQDLSFGVQLVCRNENAGTDTTARVDVIEVRPVGRQDDVGGAAAFMSAPLPPAHAPRSTPAVPEGFRRGRDGKLKKIVQKGKPHPTRRRG